MAVWHGLVLHARGQQQFGHDAATHGPRQANGANTINVRPAVLLMVG